MLLPEAAVPYARKSSAHATDETTVYSHVSAYTNTMTLLKCFSSMSDAVTV
jgi:CMP-2-keto-3-deoxyoctulosonic acid synthetase